MATDLPRLRELLERIWKLCEPILSDHPGPGEHVRIFSNFKETLGRWGESCAAVSADIEGAAKWCDRLKRTDDANWLRSANIRLNELWNSTFANLTPEVSKVLFQPMDGESIEHSPDGGMHIPWLERAWDYNGSNLCVHIRRIGQYARQLLQSLEADELTANLQRLRDQSGASGDESPLAGLDRNNIAVLFCLSNREPILQTLDDIVVSAKVSRDTASKTLKELIDDGLACRPKGRRKGATVTDKGRTMAAQIRRKSGAISTDVRFRRCDN